MKKTYISIFILMLFSLSQTLMAADKITFSDLPYFCDFEDDNELANWTLNPKATTKNLWTVGSCEAYSGARSIYISNNGGQTFHYDNTNNLVVAYRPVRLPAGTYDVAFDWKGAGNGNKGYLKMMLVNYIESRIICQANTSEPAWLKNNATNCLNNKEGYLCGSNEWKHYQDAFTLPTAYDNKNIYLVMIWVNNDTKIDTTSIMVDNLQLGEAPTTRSYPTNINVQMSMGNANVRWEGTQNADSFLVRYREKPTGEWHEIYTKEQQVTLSGITFGAYEFWVSAFYGSQQTVFSVFPTVYVYQTDCFDMLNMYNATFETGNWSAVNNTIVKKSNVKTDMIDDGYLSRYSRHTTHFDHNEIDPRTVITNSRGDTINGLPTVPDDEYGTVRLGNWQIGSEYESVSFKYTVSSNDNAVLLLKYAMVLENPNHKAKDQPRFTLNIYDENGRRVDDHCAQVDFHAPTDDELKDPEVSVLWHTSHWRDVESNRSCEIYWQEWKQIGVSLENYIGQTLTVEFTSYDCDQGGHFGYAYLTINCSRSDVDGLPWGDDATTQLFTAPDGFDYAWYKVAEGETIFSEVLSTDRYFTVSERDTFDYVCRVTYPSDANCGFWFDASARPHNPFAEIQYEWVPKECKNGIFVRNTCHIGLTNQETGTIEHRYDKKISDCMWTMPDGTKTEEQYYEGFYVPVKDEGDTLTYKIWCGVYVNDALFQDTTTLQIIVPAIGPLETHFYDTICRGESVLFPLNSFDFRKDEGEYRDSLTSLVTGCDSTVFLHLHVIEPVYEHVYDTICREGGYLLNGRTYTNTGIYRDTLYCNQTGCDSIHILHLQRAERPQMRAESTELCGDDPLVMNLSGTEWVDSIRFFVPNAVDTIVAARTPNLTLVIPQGRIRANRYTGQLFSYMSWCDTYVDTLYFNINLASTVVDARFDDVLALLNAEYNGGYRFVTYQWYRNGEAIEGATKSYYYEVGMTHDAEYSVEVVLDDGTVLRVCPFKFDERRVSKATDSDIALPLARIVRRGESIEVPSEDTERVFFYSMTGQLVRTVQHSNDHSVTIPQELHDGWWLMRVESPTPYTERILVR